MIGNLHKNSPVLSYKFKVHIDGVTTDDQLPEYFNSVDGLGKYVSVTTTSKVGGDCATSFMPQSFNTPILTLKRPLMREKSSITNWTNISLSSLTYRPTEMMIFILNPEEEITAQWNITGAIPISINISTVSVNSGTTMIEQQIKIKYKDITTVKP
jgi:phage tail-like protein